MPVNKQSVQDLIVEGELGKAIKQLLELGKAFSSDLLNETTLLSARFNALERDKRAGMISNDNSTMRFAQIGNSLNYLLDKVKPEWSLDIDMGDGGGGAAPASSQGQGTTAPSKQVILFLAANPKDSSRLSLDQELRRIDQALSRSKNRDNIKLEQRWAVQISDLRRALLDEAPNIIHFSGHGSEMGRIYLEDASGNGREVDAEALGDFFSNFDTIKCIVLNACYSDVQSDAIVKHGIPVIGMSRAVPDNAAIEFSEAFYDALGAGRDIDAAFKLGCSTIKMNGWNAEDIPVLRKPS